MTDGKPSNRRRRWRRLLIFTVLIGWLLYLPVHPYRPFCDPPDRSSRVEFGLRLSEGYKKSLKFGLGNHRIPYLEIGPYIFVPLFEWTGENAFWSNLNNKSALSEGMGYERSNPGGVIDNLMEQYTEETFYSKNTGRKLAWCKMIEAVVTPRERWKESENLRGYVE